MQVGDYVAVSERTGTGYGELMELRTLYPDVHTRTWTLMEIRLA